MKTVFAFGDSLTWGHDPRGDRRHGRSDRWPWAMAEVLGPEVEVIVDGLNGRTTIYDDYGSAADRNGARALPTLLHSHGPLDLVVIMLGTNDLKPEVAGTAQAAANGMRRLVEIVWHHPFALGAPRPDVVIVSPPALVASPASPRGPEQIVESEGFAPAYRELAETLGIGYFDAGSVVETSPVDGVHLEAATTRALGQALAPVIAGRLGL